MRRSLLLILLLSMGACDDIGLGVPGTGTPLPAGGLPASQTLEGGAQIRVTPAGFVKLKSVAPAIIGNELIQGMCVPQQNTFGSDVCYTNQGGCTPGCFVAVALPVPFLTISVTNANTVHLQIAASVSGSVRIDDPLLPACTASFSGASVPGDVDVGLSIDPATGALKTRINRINSISSGVSFTGCASILNRNAILTAFVDSLVSAWILDAVTPAVNAVIEEFVPTQTELAALVDLPALALTGLSASNSSASGRRSGLTNSRARKSTNGVESDGPAARIAR